MNTWAMAPKRLLRILPAQIRVRGAPVRRLTAKTAKDMFTRMNDVARKTDRERGGHEGDANPEERMDQVYVGGDWDADAEENETTSRDDRYN